MLAYGKLSRDMMAHGKGGDYIGLEFSGKVVLASLDKSLSLQMQRAADILNRPQTCKHGSNGSFCHIQSIPMLPFVFSAPQCLSSKLLEERLK